MAATGGLSSENRITAVWDKSFLYGISKREAEVLSRWMNLVMVEPLIWEVESELRGGGSGRKEKTEEETKRKKAEELGQKLEVFPGMLWQEDTVEALRLQLLGRPWPLVPPWNENLPRAIPRGATPGRDQTGAMGWMIDQWKEKQRVEDLVRGGSETSYRNGAAWKQFVSKRRLREWYDARGEVEAMAKAGNEMTLAKLACNRADAMLKTPEGRRRSLAILGLGELADHVEKRIREWKQREGLGETDGVGRFAGYWRMLTGIEIFGSLLVTRDQSQGTKKGNIGDLWYLRNIGFSEWFVTQDRQQRKWAEAWAYIQGVCVYPNGATRVLAGEVVKKAAAKAAGGEPEELEALISVHRQGRSNGGQQRDLLAEGRRGGRGSARGRPHEKNQVVQTRQLMERRRDGRRRSTTEDSGV